MPLAIVDETLASRVPEGRWVPDCRRKPAALWLTALQEEFVPAYQKDYWGCRVSRIGCERPSTRMASVSTRMSAKCCCRPLIQSTVMLAVDASD